MGWSGLFYFKINAGDGSTVIEPKVGKQMKFDLNTYKEVAVTGTDFLTSVFDASNCACDNVVLEAHYNVYFEPQTESNAFVITDVEVDIVYGLTESNACTNPKHN